MERISPGGGMPWGFRVVVGNAEQAKKTGGMIALYPRADDAYKMAIPGGEPLENLHVTLAFLGDDVTADDPQPLAAVTAGLADTYSVITARIMGHALFNPDGGDPDDEREMDSCAVYLVGDTEELPRLKEDVMSRLRTSQAEIPRQHSPYIPHVTAGYSMPIERLSYTGPVLFDRIGLAFAGTTQYFPLIGATISPYSR